MSALGWTTEIASTNHSSEIRNLETLSLPLALTWSISLKHAILLPLLTLCTVIANTGTIFVFLKDRSLREKPSDIFILILSCTDLLKGAIFLPLITPSYVRGGYWSLGEITCFLLIFVSDINATVNLLILVAISLDRFLLVSVKYPRYMRLQSRRNVYITIGVCWIIATSAGVIDCSFWNAAKRWNKVSASINFDYVCLSPPRRMKQFSLILFFVYVFLPIIAVIVLSLAFLVRLRNKLRRQRSINVTSTVQGNNTDTNADSVIIADEATGSTTGGSQSSSSPRSRYKKPAIILIVLVIAMIICLTPYCIYVIVIEMIFPELNNPRIIWNLVLLSYVNSVMNPCLYAATQSKIRRFYRLKFKKLLNF